MFESIKSLLVAGIARGMKTSSIRMFNAGRDRKGNAVNEPITSAKDFNSDERFTVRVVVADTVAVEVAREIAKVVCAQRGFDAVESTKDGALWINSSNDTTAKLLS